MASESKKRKNAAGNRSDPGWEHGIEVDSIAKKVRCKHCDKVYCGGIFRLKHHLAGTHSNVEPCLRVPNYVKEEIGALLQSNAEKRKRFLDIGESIKEESLYENEISHKLACSHEGKSIMESFVSKTKPKMEIVVNEMYREGERDEVCKQIARFLYTSGIPSDVVNNPEFLIMVEKIAEFGIGLEPPSYDEVAVKYLKKEVSSVMNMLEEHKKEWKKTGCTIVLDGWTDGERRTICNFLVNSGKGTVFLHSLDASDISKTADKVFDMLDQVVEKVGEENVVQVVTHNTAIYKEAGEKLMERRKGIFWTPCAAHGIDLMLEDFDKKFKVHSATITKARKITTFIYSRAPIHAMLKEFTEGSELIRPGVTRFATSCLTLRSLHEKKGPLIAMFASSQWKASGFASTIEGKTVQKIVLDTGSGGFWHAVLTCLKSTLPLLKVLRVLGVEDTPAMGFLYNAMQQAKDQIKANLNNVERCYKPLLDIINARWESQLHRPLHAAAYYLNPHYHYSSDFKVNAKIKFDLYHCLERMIPDDEEKVKIDIQMDEFRNARGLFGVPTAVMTRTKKSPAAWWNSYGDECPELQRFAIRILSLTCGFAGCERNRCAFEMVHAKKRNCLHKKRMSDSLFVMCNLRLKSTEQQKPAIKMQQWSFSLEDTPSDDEWITEVGEPPFPTDKDWLKVLDGVSNDEDEVAYASRILFSLSR